VQAADTRSWALVQVLHNTTNLPLTNVRVGEQRLEDGMQLQVLV